MWQSENLIASGAQRRSKSIWKTKFNKPLCQRQKWRFVGFKALFCFSANKKKPSIFVGGYPPVPSKLPIRHKDQTTWAAPQRDSFTIMIWLERTALLDIHLEFNVFMYVYMSFLCSEVFICSTVSKSCAVTVWCWFSVMLLNNTNVWPKLFPQNMLMVLNSKKKWELWEVQIWKRKNCSVQ